jgi:phosphodiesterase/alkaline phosphatase D-like protein
MRENYTFFSSLKQAFNGAANLGSGSSPGGGLVLKRTRSRASFNNVLSTKKHLSSGLASKLAVMVGMLFMLLTYNTASAQCTAAPTLVGVSNIGPNSVNLNWNIATGSTYTIEVYTNASYTTLFNTYTGVSTETYEVTGLSAGTMYFYRIKVDNSGTCADYASGNFSPRFGYTPLDATGYNQDVIANGTGYAATSTTASVDASNYAYLSLDFKATAGAAAATYGLPVNRFLNSPDVTGLNYIIPPYRLSNSLRIAGIANGTLTLTKPGKFRELYFVVASGDGSSTGTITVNFSDGTSQTTTAITYLDWFGTGTAAQPAVATGIGRVSRTSNSAQETGTGTGPKLFQVKVTIDPANQTKTVSSIRFNKTSSTAYLNVFSAGGFQLGECPVVSNTNTYTVANGTSGTLGWSLENIGTAGGTATYTLEVFSDAGYVNPIAGSPFTGITSTSYTISGLTPVTTYYYRIKATNGTCTSGYSTGSFAHTYCTPTSTTATSNYITAFSTTTGFGNITNTGTGSGAYNSYTSQSVIKSAGTTFNYNGTKSATGARLNIYVDWNKDLDFDDAGETVATIATGATAYSGTITIPAGTANGTYRMRLRASSATTVTPCGLLTNGETEDYSISVVTQPPACSTPSAATSVALSVTSSTATATITASGTPTGYIIVRSTSATLGAAPVDTTVYAVGNTIGSGTVVANTTSTTFNDTGLAANTQYYYYVYAYNHDSTFTTCYGPVYSGVTSANAFTCALAPDIIYPSNITSSSANLNWVSAAGSTYTVEVYSDPSYTTLVTSSTGVSGGSLSLDSLEYNVTYYYRVKVDTAGVTCSAYGTGSFTAKGSYTPLDVTGFNQDVIANGVGLPSTSTSSDVDGANYCYVAMDYKQTTGSSALTRGLPLNRSLSSISIPGLKFNMQSYSGNNDLRLAGQNATGTITLTTPLRLSNVYLALTAGNVGSNSCNVRARMYFNDNTYEEVTVTGLPDWYDNKTSTSPTPTLIEGIGRVNRSSNGLETSTTDPNIHQITFPISSENQIKKITHIEFTNTSPNAAPAVCVANIFAVSGQVISSCPNIGSASAANTSTSSIDFSWTLGNPGESSLPEEVTYTLEVFTDSNYTVAAPGSPFTGISGTTKSVTGLTLGTTYYYRVKANNGICDSDYALGSIALAYCTPTTSNTGSYYIYSFSTTGGYTNITNNNTNYVAAFNNYSSQSVTKAAGQSFNYSVSLDGYAYGKIWVDWNGDLDFDDANEFITTVGYGTSYPSVFTGTIAIPAGTPVGNYRMRVRSAYYFSDSNTYGSCGNTNYGETEDYTVQVVPTPPNCATPDAATVALSAVTSNSLSATVTGPATTPTGYLVIRSTSATLSAAPVNVTEYTVGSLVGGGTVVSVGTATTVAQPSLNANTHYYYFVYTYNNGGATCLGPIYSTTAGTADATTCIGQSLVVGASNIRNSSATINWTSVSGGGATAVAYNLEVFTDASYTTSFASYPGLTVTKYGIQGLTANAYYYYRIQAVAAGSCSATPSTGSFQATNGFTPIDVTSGGYNQDVIANGSGAAQYSTTAPVDATGAGNAYVARDYVDGNGTATTVGLPVNRFLSSSTTSGLNFIVPDYNGNNSLRLAGQNDNGTLTFETPVKLTDLYIATTGGSGALTASAEIIFEDGGTSQITTGIAIPDWVTGTGSVIVNNLGRANRTNTTGGVETLASKIFQIAIPVSVANQTRKVAAVKFTKTSTGTTEPVFNIFAISGKIIGDCPTMASTAVNTVNATGAEISWTLSAAGDGGTPTYTVEVYTDAAFTTQAITPVSGLTGTNYTIVGLTAQTVYYYRVKATNTACESGYVTGSFTTSQVPATLNWTADFEGTPSWSLVNGTQTNKWYIGSAAASTGTKSLYISNDNGTTNGYDVNSLSTVQAYRDIAIPAGTTTVEFSFDWKGVGEGTSTMYDYFRVWLVPASYTPESGTQIGAATGRIQVGGYFNQQATYATFSNPTLDLSSFAGQTARLVFEWRNDGSLGTQPSASIDNVRMAIPTCFTPSNLTVVSSFTYANISWTAPATAPSNGYQYYYSTTNTTPSAATVGTAVTTGTSTTISALTASTTYYYWVRSVCDGADKSPWVSGGSFFTGFCTPTYSNCDSTHRITLVTVPEISFSDDVSASTACSAAATDRTAKQIAVISGSTYTFNATSTGFESVGLAIDFNGNANFADSGEIVALPNYQAGNPQVYTMSVAIPSGATPGSYRLRIWNREANAGAGTSPCGSYAYGSYVDYTIVISAPCFTWTGTASTVWSNTANWCGGLLPTSSSDVIIAATSNNPVITTGTAYAHNLTVAEGATLTVATGATLSVDNLLSVNPAGTLTVQDNGALIQGASTTSDVNSGKVVFHKKSSNLFRLDYTLWASPVAGQDLALFSPATSTNRFYEYNTVTDQYAGITAGGTSFDTAKSYLIRMPNGNATSGYNAGTTAIQFDGTFTGAPGNGTITKALSTEGTRYNAVGNPYPSPINVADFFNGNSSVIDGTSGIYLWRKTNSGSSSSYATITLAAFTANPSAGGGSDNDQFYVYDPTTGSANWLLAPAQGFIVRAQNIASPSLTFTNAMRRPTPGSSQSFFRQGADRASRLWLNISAASNGAASQTAIAYMDNATLALDYGYDAKKFAENNTVALYSIADNTPLTVQARPAFTNTDVVPMGFVAPSAGSFTITLDHVNGAFSNGQAIYLRDNAEGVIRNLNEGGYTFATEAGTFDTRFDVLYNTQVLGTDNPVLDANTVAVFKQGTTIQINTGSVVMNCVTIYDIRGRKVYSMDNVNNTQAAITNLTAEQQVLIVEVNTVKGKVSKRIVF